MRTRTTVVAVAVTGAALVAASGAAASAPAASASQIVVRAIAASKTARSVEVVGSVSTAKQTIGLDVRVSNADQGEGTIIINGAVIKLVRRGALVYFNGDAAFWAQSAGASGATFAGRWVSVPASGTDGKSFAQFLGTKSLFTQILSGSHISQSTFTLEANTAVSGVPVFAIAGTNTKTGSTGTAYVARKGRPYLIELDDTSTAGKGKLTFLAYNKPVHVAVPAHVVSLQKLEQQAAAATAG